MSDLFKKGVPFKFGPTQQVAMGNLKERLTEAPVLKILDPKAETEIYTNASIHRFGCILLKRDIGDGNFHPV